LSAGAPAPHHLEAFQPQPAVGRALADLEIVFVAVPGAQKMDFMLGKLLPVPATVGPDHVLDLVHEEALAGRSALVQA
jgi:hypothetical protein